MAKKQQPLGERELVINAWKHAFLKLDPRIQVQKPAILLVFLSAVMATIMFILSLAGFQNAPEGFTLGIAAVLWGTVLAANFGEAAAESRGKAQAEALRAARKQVEAQRIPSPEGKDKIVKVPSEDLIKGDIVIVHAGEQIPADGEVIEGAASVDESAITGESAPVIRESGSDRSAVTGGTTVISDWLVIQVTNTLGDGFLNQMIAMAEGNRRKRIPWETALQISLIVCSAVIVMMTVLPGVHRTLFEEPGGIQGGYNVTYLIALLACLSPTAIGALLSVIRIAGMGRLNQANVLAASDEAVEMAGNVDILMLNQAGAITLGSRKACEFIPVDGNSQEELADAAQLASLADETLEGRSVVVLAKEAFNIRGRSIGGANMKFVPVTAADGLSGVNYEGTEIRKGPASAVRQYLGEHGGIFSEECDAVVKRISAEGGTPLIVVKNHIVLGVIHLKDIIKKGMKEKFSDLQRMGLKTIMITEENPMTAAAIAAEAGVDDFLAEASPESRLALVREYQGRGHLVAVAGDGTKDAPAMAQADMAVAMGSGTLAAKEAGTMVDLDSSPTKLMDIVAMGRQLRLTKGSLTAFSIANDLTKYFVILPSLFMGWYPGIASLNIMHLENGYSAVVSAILYNVLTIMILLPLAVKGVRFGEGPYRSQLLRKGLLYGLGGIVTPFAAIKLIDWFITGNGLV